MLPFVLLIMMLWYFSLMAICNIQIKKKRMVILWICFVILLAWLAYQFELNGSNLFDLERFYLLLNNFRKQGCSLLVEHLEMFLEKSWFILLYALSGFPNDKIITIISCVVVYGIFGWIMLDTLAVERKERISIRHFCYAMILMEGVCDYGYRVATEVRNVLAFSLIALGIYLYVRCGKWILCISLALLSTSFHSTCIILLIFAALYKVFPRTLQYLQWCFVFWQPFQKITGLILVRIPIPFVEYVGRKILKYAEYNEYHHWLFYFLFILLMALYVYVLHSLARSEASKKEKWLFSFLTGISLFCLGSIGTVPAMRFPLILGFFSPMYVKKIYSESVVPYGKGMIVIMCGVSFLFFIYWVLYMHVSLRASGATWVF